MSELTRLGILATIIQAVVLVVVIAKTNKLIKREKNFFLPFFFILSMLSFFLSDVYWLAYDFLKPDIRMPIASNEIAECAMVLLLSAALESILTDKRKYAGEIAFAFLFIGANIALWIVWSGEWFQDIFFGIPYIYFLWLIIRGLKTRQALSQREMRLAMMMSVFVLIMHVAIRFIDGFSQSLVVFLCHVFMFGMIVWLGVRSVRLKDFFVSSAFFLWTNLVMFSSVSFYYYIAFFASTIALPMMYISMKKELLSDDIC